MGKDSSLTEQGLVLFKKVYLLRKIKMADKLHLRTEHRGRRLIPPLKVLVPKTVPISWPIQVTSKIEQTNRYSAYWEVITPIIIDLKLSNT